MALPTYSTGGYDGGGFASRFPELVAPAPSAADQTRITSRLSQEHGRLSSSVWGVERDEAALLRVAHWWTLYRAALAGGGQAVGPLTGESVGEWSQSFGEPAAPSASNAADGGYPSTIYGQEYLRLRAVVIAKVSRVGQ